MSRIVVPLVFLGLCLGNAHAAPDNGPRNRGGSSLPEAARAYLKKTTLENLMEAYGGERNAAHRYLKFAKKADEEGYGKVASLFRAAAKAEQIHAANHAEVIRQLRERARTCGWGEWSDVTTWAGIEPCPLRWLTPDGERLLLALRRAGVTIDDRGGMPEPVRFRMDP